MTERPTPTMVEYEETIDAPAADIFAILSVPETIPEYWPVASVSSTDDAECALAYTVTSDALDEPITLPLEPCVTEVDEPTSLIMTIKGAIEGRVEWTLQSHNDTTLVTAAVTSTLTTPSFEDAVTGKNKEGVELQSTPGASPSSLIEKALTNLKTLCEQPSPPASLAPSEIPTIYCPFSGQMSPHLEEVTAHSVNWAREMGLLNQESAPPMFRTMPRLTCRGHSQEAPVDELCLHSDWVTWAFLYDDYIDSTELGAQPAELKHFQRPLLAVFEEKTTKPFEEPLVRAFADIWERVSTRMPPTWQERFAQHHRDCFAAQQWEADNRTTNRIPERTTFISKRRHTGAAFIGFDLVELVEDIAVPPAVYQREDLTALREAGSNIVMWTNDVYSLHKELMDNEVNNLAVVVHQEQGCSLQDAVTEVCEMIDAETHRFEELAQTITSDPDTDINIQAYQMALERWIGGNLTWSKESLRYGHPD